jgi:hypothetical protein
MRLPAGRGAQPDDELFRHAETSAGSYFPQSSSNWYDFESLNRVEIAQDDFKLHKNCAPPQ